MPAGKPIPKIIFIAPLSLLLILLLAWMGLMFMMRGPLAGDNKHDFGQVEVPVGQPAVLTHTFHFSNRTGKPLTVNWARPDCGCLTIHGEFPRTLEPGEFFDMPITMRYAGPAPKQVLIHIDCGEAGTQSAWVWARAMRRDDAAAHP